MPLKNKGLLKGVFDLEGFVLWAGEAWGREENLSLGSALTRSIQRQSSCKPKFLGSKLSFMFFEGFSENTRKKFQ